MIQDDFKTNVAFYLATYPADEADEQATKEVIAVFVDENVTTDKDTFFDCYAHIGQHSICSKSFLAENCRKINKKEQHKDLKIELESIGYNLNVI